MISSWELGLSNTSSFILDHTENRCSTQCYAFEKFERALAALLLLLCN